MELKDKIAGALYGMALGDAMGMPAELWGRERARKFFGGKITEFIDGPKENDVAFNYNKAQFTDDTGQAMVLLDSLKATGFITARRPAFKWALTRSIWTAGETSGSSVWA